MRHSLSLLPKFSSRIPAPILPPSRTVRMLVSPINVNMMGPGAIVCKSMSANNWEFLTLPLALSVPNQCNLPSFGQILGNPPSGADVICTRISGGAPCVDRIASLSYKFPALCEMRTGIETGLFGVFVDKRRPHEITTCNIRQLRRSVDQ